MNVQPNNPEPSERSHNVITARPAWCLVEGRNQYQRAQNFPAAAGQQEFPCDDCGIQLLLSAAAIKSMNEHGSRRLCPACNWKLHQREPTWVTADILDRHDWALDYPDRPDVVVFYEVIVEKLKNGIWGEGKWNERKDSRILAYGFLMSQLQEEEAFREEQQSKEFSEWL